MHSGEARAAPCHLWWLQPDPTPPSLPHTATLPEGTLDGIMEPLRAPQPPPLACAVASLSSPFARPKPVVELVERHQPMARAIRATREALPRREGVVVGLYEPSQHLLKELGTC